MTSMDIDQIQVDTKNLYREETITDLKVATIRRLTPIQADGSPDASRKAIFSASTHVMSQMGLLPINVQLEADTLEAAIREFPSAIRAGVEQMIEDAREYQRQEANRIVVPRAGMMPPGAATGRPPGAAGGGSIIAP